MENYEQKYKEALEKAKFLKENTDSVGAKDISRCFEEIFPEIKESEDERIKEEIIHLVKKSNEYGGYALHKDAADRMINWLEKQGNKTIVTPQWMIDFLDEHRRHFGTPMDYDKRKEVDGKLLCIKEWLEKQGEKEKTPCDRCRKEQPSHSCQDITSLGRCYMEGEQTPTDEFKPKFKVGDWIVEPREDEPDYLWHIDRIEDDTYWYDAVNAGVKVAHADNNYHIWTIQDAKDGDVISYDDGWTCIFKHIDGIYYSSYCFITADGKFHMGYKGHAVNSKINGNANPAAKEQRDRFFEKMKEAGYEWDVKEKKLNLVKS